MGTVVRIKKGNTAAEAKEALSQLIKSRQKQRKKIADYYGKQPGLFGDGLTYQKKLRDEWQ